MVSLPATSMEAAAEFPRKGVLLHDVDRPAAKFRRVLHTVLFGSAIVVVVNLAHPERERVVALVGLSGNRWALVLVVLVTLAAFAVMGADSESVVAWEMYAIGGVVALVENIRVGMGADLGLLAGGSLWVVAYFWRKVRHTRRARWRRLRQVVDHHQLVDASVVSHRWFDTPGSDAVDRLRLVLASPQLPGHEWRVQLSLQTRQVDAAPETGVRVLMFVCPSDPGVAVVRPVLPA